MLIAEKPLDTRGPHISPLCPEQPTRADVAEGLRRARYHQLELSWLFAQDPDAPPSHRGAERARASILVVARSGLVRRSPRAATREKPSASAGRQHQPANREKQQEPEQDAQLAPPSD